MALNNDCLEGFYRSQIGHIWSQVVTLVTVRVKNLNKDDFDGYFGSMALNKELLGRVRRRRNASLIDLLALPQVKTGIPSPTNQK